MLTRGPPGPRGARGIMEEWNSSRLWIPVGARLPGPDRQRAGQAQLHHLQVIWGSRGGVV